MGNPAQAAPPAPSVNGILIVPGGVLRPPVGVQEIIDTPHGSLLSMVSMLDWRLFSYREDADALLKLLTEKLGINASVIEDGEEASRFVFAAANSADVGPRVFSIVGTDAQGNPFYEVAGDILARRVRPDFGVDKGEPYKPGDVLDMKLSQEYGYSEFFWEKTAPKQGA